MLPFLARSPAALRSCLLASLFALAPALALAHTSSGNAVDSTTCGGHESSSSLFGSVFLQCSGGLGLSGGKLTSNSVVDVQADGALALQNLSIQAPLIELVSEGALSFSGASKIDGLAWNIVDGRIISTKHGTPGPSVLASGSTLFDGLPGHALATPSEISWEIFSVPGSSSYSASSSSCFDLPGFGRIGPASGAALLDLYFDKLVLASDLKNGNGSIFIEVAGKGGALLTITPVPEPGAWALMLAGLAALGMTAALARRRGA